MPFPRLSNIPRLSDILRRQHQREPAYTPLPTTPSLSPVSPAQEPLSPVHLSTPSIWGSAAEIFTGVRDESWYEDLLDLMLDECAALEAAQCSSDAGVTGLKGEEGELLFDADVWVELARSEQGLRPVRRCAGSCAVRKVCYGDADTEELRRLTEAFVGDYYDGECTCLDGSVAGGLCLPGENFRSARSVSLGGETSAGNVSWETSARSASPPWETAGSFLLAKDEQSVASDTESIFDHMDEVMQDGLWEDAEGGAEVSTVIYLPDFAHDRCCSPPTPRFVVSGVSEHDQDEVIIDFSEHEEELSSDLPFPIYYFDADMQQYAEYTAYNQLLIRLKPEGARSIVPKPSVRSGRVVGNHYMY